VAADGRVIGELPGLAVDGERAQRVIRKIFKGIYFFERQVRITEFIIFRGAEIRPRTLNTTGWPEHDMGEVFRYRSLHESAGSGIWIEFYRTDWWFALSGDFARNYRPR